jgi:negative regulator of replication initiation
MNQMKMHTIEIDENLWRYLQKNAEPFIDTPNSVLNRLLFDTINAPSSKSRLPEIPAVSIQGIPKSLAQILEVVYEMEINGYSRTEATRRVAHKRGTSPHTITDKYCRQIGKKAHEIDQLLSEAGYESFKKILESKYDAYRQVIESYFETLLVEAR